MNHKYYIDIAKEIATASKDPSSKVGCLIIGEDKTPVSWGYNGMIAGSDESFFSWERPMKYYTVLHAEQNAVLFSNRSNLLGCKVYVTHGPCEVCLKLLLQARVREIYYEDASIMRDRGSVEQKQAIQSLIQATKATVMNINGKEYVTELLEGK